MSRDFYKKLAIIALPIIAQELLSNGVNLLNLMMVGSLDLDSINGVALANQVFFLFSLVNFGVCSGSSILMGQSWGKQDAGSIHKVMGICFTVALGVAVVFAATSIAVPKVILGLYSDKQDVIEKGALYLRVVAVSYLFYAVSVVFNAACRATGNTRIPMTTTTIALFCDGALNYILIFVLELGVLAPAIATITARAVELTAMIVIVKKLHLPIGARITRYFKGNSEFIKKFLKIVVPVIANESLWALGTTLYTVAYKYCGNEAQGAVAINAQIFNVFWVVGMGFSAGCGVIIANEIGAGEVKGAVVTSRRAIRTGLAAAAVMGAVMALFAPIMVQPFNVSQSVKDMAMLLIRIQAVGILIKTYNFVTIVSILRSGGDTVFCLLVDGLGVWIVGVPLGFLGAAVLHLPVYIVLIMIYSEELFKGVLTFFRVRSNKWVNRVV